MNASSAVKIPKVKQEPTVLEKFLLSSPLWQEGYKTFNRLFGRPLGWLFIPHEDGHHRLVRLDRKGNCTFYRASASNEQSCETFLFKYAEQICHDEQTQAKLPSFYRCAFGKNGAIFGLKHLGRLRGVLILCSFVRPEKEIAALLAPFDHFVNAHVELAYKAFELNNFYETVHPRAIALSTMHSVHRVINASLRLHELLPRIGRLSAQVLKAKGCSIMLVDPTNEYLLPYFSFGDNPKFVHRQRIKIGRGLEGHIAKTGEFHLTRHSIGVPFIEDDVVGILTLWNKIDNQPFTKMDLEILKSVSEQAVVAIKNAQLYEETEQLTLGSIKTINELLELNFGSDRRPLRIFMDVIMEIGKGLELSGKELIHLERAVLLLDTGTLTLPEQVWRKKGKLTKREFDLIKRIPMRGADLLSSISSLKPVIPVILHQHERYDGKGYPEGLKAEEIPIGARIVSVIDSFVAMISSRAYREPMSLEAAVAEIQANRGTQFDPHVVDCFLKVLRSREVWEKFKAYQKQASQHPGHSGRRP